ncbi:hypothetical protein FQN54_006354 [Arachnomyces sp. PD_36]|nr:hypothetical protein FQN54_006354 [Arachnomyces sp. PD_36]
MDISQEVVDIIISFIDPEDRPKYVTVSRQWQNTIEPQTFKSVRVKSTELDYFARVYTPEHRRAVLGFIDYQIILPEYPLWKCTKLEKSKDQDANNEAFTKAIVDLFSILNSWETADSAGNRGGSPIKLQMSVRSPTDDPMKADRIDGDLGAFRWLDSVLKLLRPDDVKPVGRVTKLYWAECQEDDFPEDPSMRDVDAAAIAAVATKLPKLEAAVWSLRDREFPGTQPRYQQRHDFAHQLSAIESKHLKRFVLCFLFNKPRNETFTIPSGLHPSDGPNDSLSVSLHKLSQAPELEYLFLGGHEESNMVLSPSVFWPEDSSSTPLWPSLQTVHVNISNTTPSGSWYFTGDEEDMERPLSRDPSTTSPTAASETELSENSETYFADTYHHHHAAVSRGDYPELHFRTRLDSTMFNPLLKSIAKAVLRMPVLKRFNFAMMTPEETEPIEWYFLEKGVKSYESENPSLSETRRIMFVGGESEWSPDDELRSMWGEIVGEDGRIYYN